MRLRRWKIMALFYKLILSTVFVGLAAISIGEKAQALSGTYPDSSVSSTPSVHAMVSIAGDNGNITLTAQYAYFRVFIPEYVDTNVTITIDKACSPNANYFESDGRMEASILSAFDNDDQDGVADNAPMSMTSTNPKNNSSHCNSGNDLTFTVDGENFNVDEGRYGIHNKSVIVKVSKTGGAGIRSFKVVSSIGQVSFDDLGTNRAKQPGQPSFGAYSVWDSRDIASNPESNYTFTFAPDCKYNNELLWLKWDDADSGEENEERANNIKWSLVDVTAGRTIDSRSGLTQMGGNADYKEYELKEPLKKGHMYEWRWENVNRRNGIQMWAPFSDKSVDVDCSRPVCGDPGQPACKCGEAGGPPPPCEPKNPTVDKNCSQFEHNMSNDKYRFTIFNNREVKHTSSPAEGQYAASGNDWKFKEFDAVNMGYYVDRFEFDDAGKFHYDYPNPSRDWVVYLEKWTKQSDGSWRYTDGNASATDIGRFVQEDCYVANCSISFSGDKINGKPNSFAAGSTIKVNGTLGNIGNATLEENFGGYRLSLTEPGTAGTAAIPHYIGYPVYAGSNGYASFDRAAGATRGTYTVKLYPDYYGKGPVGAICEASYDVYERYEFELTADSSLMRGGAVNTEDPEIARFVTSIKQNGVDVDSKSTRTYYKEHPGEAPVGLAPFGPNEDSRNFGNVNYSDDYNIPEGSFRIEDRYCVVIELERGSGWRGPGDTYLNDSAAGATNCKDVTGCAGGHIVCNPPPEPVKNNPYVRVYGSDVAVGGGFSPNCGVGIPRGSGIYTFMSHLAQQAAGTRSGSGGQLGALALTNEISGFTSASLRNSSPSHPRGLTFANTSPSSVDLNSERAEMGGKMTGSGTCAPDYFAETQYPDANTTMKHSRPGGLLYMNSLAGTIANGRQTLANGSVTIDGDANYSKRHTVYVNGDALINGNIAYAPNYAGGIPNFTLVVKGNIYISPSVTQLDGFYVAQPVKKADGTFERGHIYTCANAAGYIIDPADLFSLCGASQSVDNCDNPGANASQLRVNGSFAAERVILSRTVYSLRCSAFKEEAANSKAAEIFHFSPELYLSPPVFSPRSTSTSGEHDYITTLPPIL